MALRVNITFRHRLSSQGFESTPFRIEKDNSDKSVINVWCLNGSIILLLVFFKTKCRTKPQEITIFGGICT